MGIFEGIVVEPLDDTEVLKIVVLLEELLVLPIAVVESVADVELEFLGDSVDSLLVINYGEFGEFHGLIDDGFGIDVVPLLQGTVESDEQFLFQLPDFQEVLVLTDFLHVGGILKLAFQFAHGDLVDLFGFLTDPVEYSLLVAVEFIGIGIYAQQ